MPAAVLVHDNFTGPTGMGVVVGRHARWLLQAGWSVTLVGENVPPDLADSCTVLRVPAPRQLPSLFEHLGWCARARRALHELRADVIHAHSPLLASAADVVTSHFMSRPSFLRGERERSPGITGYLRRVQSVANRHLDDRAYRRLVQSTYMSFVSEFLREEFTVCYGMPKGGWVFAPPAPPWNPPSQAEREAARKHFGVPAGALCVGYSGGSDPRKGFFRLGPLAREDVFVLFAGPGSERLTVAGARGVGFIDMDKFHAACDVIAAPAVFDSAPVAVLQAIARDVPVVTTPFSGWATAIQRSNAGIVWRPDQPLIAAIRRAASETGAAARRQFLAEFS